MIWWINLVTFIHALDNDISTIEIDSNGEQIPSSEQISFDRVAMLFALVDEAKPIIDQFKLTKSSEFNEIMDPMQVYTNDNQTIFIICNGFDRTFNVQRIGTQSAAINAFLTIKYIKPDLIMSVGIAGAIKNNINDIPVNIGDVFIANKVMYHDRRINVKPWSNGWHLGMYSCYDIHQNKILPSEKEIKFLRKDENIIVSSGNSFPESTHDHQIWEKYGSHLTEMEAAGIAEVCLEKSVAFAAIKAISNYVYTDDDGVGVEEFEHHMKMSINQLASVTIEVVKIILQT